MSGTLCCAPVYPFNKALHEMPAKSRRTLSRESQQTEHFHTARTPCRRTPRPAPCPRTSFRSVRLDAGVGARKLGRVPAYSKTEFTAAKIALPAPVAVVA